MFHVYYFAQRLCKPILAVIIEDAPNENIEPVSTMQIQFVSGIQQFKTRKVSI